MHVKEPDILLLPVLLPLFLLGSVPLLLLAFLGYAGLGLAGLLMLLARNATNSTRMATSSDTPSPTGRNGQQSAPCNAPTCWPPCGWPMS